MTQLIYLPVGPNRGIRHAPGRYRHFSLLHGMDFAHGNAHLHYNLLQLNALQLEPAANSSYSRSLTPAILSMTFSLLVFGRFASLFSLRS